MVADGDDELDDVVPLNRLSDEAPTVEGDEDGADATVPQLLHRDRVGRRRGDHGGGPPRSGVSSGYTASMASRA